MAPGSNVSFIVVVTSSLCRDSFTYQWRFNGSDVAGATHASLNLTNVSSADAGDYVVEIRNRQNNLVVSDPARLTLLGPPRLLTPATLPNGGFRLVVESDPDRLYEIQATTNFVVWQTLVSLTNTNGRLEWIDLGASNFLDRFYRVRGPP